MKETKETSLNEKQSEKNEVSSSIYKPAKVGATVKQTIKLLVTNFFNHNVGRSGAALAYYLLFALFPLLIFISNLLGQLDLNMNSITGALSSILPHDVVAIIENYLEYVSQNSSRTLLGFSLVFTIYFPWRAIKGLMDDIRQAYGLKSPKRLISYTMYQLIYTVVFLVVIAVSLLASTLGRHVLTYIVNMIPSLKALQIPNFIITLWHYLRFLLIGVIMFIALSALYAISQDERQPRSAILPGAIAALIAWLIVSAGFSFYVEHFANYSIIYGTLGTVIVLLLWLYMTAVILILGAEFNAALLTVRQGIYDTGSRKLKIK